MPDNQGNPPALAVGRDQYTYLHIEQLSYNSATFAVQFGFSYGTLDEQSRFVVGSASGLRSVVAVGEDLTAIQNEMAQEGEPALPACFRLGYAFIQKKLGIEGSLDYDLPTSDVAPTPTES